MHSHYSDLSFEEEKSKGIIPLEELTSSNGIIPLDVKRTDRISDALKIIKTILAALDHSRMQDIEIRYTHSNETFIIVQSCIDQKILVVEKTDEFIHTSQLISKCFIHDEIKEFENALKPLFKEVIRLHSVKDYNQIDSIIEKFIQKDFSIKSTIGLLMITHKIKTELLLWSKLIEYTKRVAYNADYSSERLARLIIRFS